MTEQRLISSFADLIASEDWPSGSTDLNPLDNSLWPDLDTWITRAVEYAAEIWRVLKL